MQVSPHRRIMERRRLRAWQLHERGWKGCDIAKVLGVTQAAVSMWLTSARNGGTAALEAKPRTGAPSRLSARHRLMLAALLRDAPSAYGIASDTWTIADVRQMIERVFGVRYTPQHVGRLMRGAQNVDEHLPPMLKIELQELLGKNNIGVVRRRVAQRSQARRSS
ncbi:MAG: hypothetical protein FGM24_04140 [Candidatus Kapabacteria bacterium]|nr:hypothetical protein [Candidatus Kapabacteria bacterium]